MHKEIRTSAELAPRRYLAGVSFGVSSTCLVQMLDDTARHHAAKQSSSAFEPLIVHVDTDLAAAPTRDGETPAQRLLAKYRRRYPHVSFDCVHLSRAMALRTVDWSALLPAGVTAADCGASDDVERLRRLFAALPSVTSRADVLRQLVRHVLIDTARAHDYSVVLLGHSTSALAALTLAEVANGRGFSVPGQVGDGIQTVCEYDDRGDETARVAFPVYYPLREVLKNELVGYVDLIPALADMKRLRELDGSAGGGSSVVSHRDVSIEEVMQRYFDGVEGPYSGIVANVVRTTGKLDRVAGGASCRLCSMPLDDSGDNRWAGDLGQDSGDSAAENHREKLCYGCRRAVSG
ncbi:Thiouridylase subunit 2 [Cordyceps fumosorosea ARSEF 2679]|uniref:Thiouridylase subunit 2 n=1 Tax=Cordyceps fumosorosea (strain ARSEF 2679) TaxID=1081104 RepID=A0A167XJS4_CORFA|nr:Thiouridylase subunit 2 [Cordyceps fumosorosea ARSEF 2679]OAA65058.1 Thiouridylase subunit 2 [Cordyceps fumosorosea ARSEF 2679]